MTSVVSGERATATWLTGAAGLLVLAVAVVMMVVAAPARSGSDHAATQAAQMSEAMPAEYVDAFFRFYAFSPGIPHR